MYDKDGRLVGARDIGHAMTLAMREQRTNDLMDWWLDSVARNEPDETWFRMAQAAFLDEAD